MYDYIICMKSGKEYKIKTQFKFEELIMKIMPKQINEIKISHFELVECAEKNVAIIGSEISSIEYYVKVG